MRYDQPLITNEDIAEACEDAAALLEGHWVRGEWYQENVATQQHHYCLEGALGAALGIDPRKLNSSGSKERQWLIGCPVTQAIVDTLNLRRAYEDYAVFEFGPDDLPTWNDAEERTESEVLDLLHATTKRVLGGQG